MLISARTGLSSWSSGRRWRMNGSSVSAFCVMPAKITHPGGGARAGLNPDHPAQWHMIGHLQRNKARKVVDSVRLVHSVDSLRLAEELQGVLRKTDRRLDVLLQVNVSAEPSKHGCLSPAVPAMVEQIETMYSLRLRGMMTIAPYSADPEDSRLHFARCRELFEEVRESGAGEGAFNLLSMGMSGDFEVAIEEGANIVRVGSAIFTPPADGAGESSRS